MERKVDKKKKQKEEENNKNRGWGVIVVPFLSGLMEKVARVMKKRISTAMNLTPPYATEWFRPQGRSVHHQIPRL